MKRKGRSKSTNGLGADRSLLFGLLLVGVAITVIVPRLPLNSQSLDLIKWIWGQLFAVLMGVNIGRAQRG